MRRILFAVLASAALVVAVPAVAMARHDDGRRHEHQRAHHRAHARHARVRHERRGREHDFPPARLGDAGTVQSFNDRVLVIMLNDGSTVSGNVTQATELRCDAGEPAEMGIDDHGRGGDGSSGDGPSGGDRGDHGDRGDDAGQDGQMCAAGALTPGAMVHEAELRITSVGAVWEEVELTTES